MISAIPRIPVSRVVSGTGALSPGAAAVVFSPLFPVSLDDRARFAALVGRSR
jgi:hypothetical protein